MKRGSHIAIFDTFKTHQAKSTRESKRQRGIIAHIALEKDPSGKTRTSIAHILAKKYGIAWQNIYSAIFKDLDEVLIPAKVVKEGGRLPIKRGPKALQIEGIPYYELTNTGLIIASTIEETGDIRYRMKLLELYISNSSLQNRNQATNNSIINDGILLLSRYAPSFILKIINEYIIAYNRGEIERLDTLDLENFKKVISKQITIEKELVEACMVLSNDKKEVLRNFIDKIS
ncbi:MAG: hypothetical protein AB7V56_01370 [Candidatus Nitrosocosmicus sp.]|uniref:hypothetical protein n=1 Tax=Candidatus Nitrosocosmicus agrestis TaxID=2563600 RepID=UPI00122E4B54|nr:hypothetical protein [Candidatus Nitrosocosmicus sp. SS]KAA2283779.1 hypothetical protein F1Z66_00380 [Candidatus Nitrosocosmicus sp. SS]KAF0870155.1 hypothetical protein E5N71_01105 [Candidatus Nitrosocosmicus sp. SS]MDR4489324.1 hypothetical protein [Candidatus Nitrosocosmicus sp.]